MTPALDLLLRCAAQAAPCALVTIRAIQGRSPRRVGAQMAVSLTQSAGSISAGCVDQEIIAQARAQLQKDGAQQRRSVQLHLGEEANHFDLKLPCGSKMLLQIDSAFSDSSMQNLALARSQRLPCYFRWPDDSRAAVIELQNAMEESASKLTIVVHPPLRLVIAGKGEAWQLLAKLALSAGLVVEAFAGEANALSQLQALGATTSLLLGPPSFSLDPYTAALTLFHEHELEQAFLAHALAQTALLIAAMGSPQVHAQRLHALQIQGFDQTALARIESPFGLIARARDAQTLAVSMLAACLQRYRDRFFPEATTLETL